MLAETVDGTDVTVKLAPNVANAAVKFMLIFRLF
jgi:hypothetical protein